MANKTPKTEPNIRQRRAIKEMVENGGNQYQALKKAGYSDNYASDPKKIRNTKSWQQLLDEYLPDELLTKVANEGLSATSVDKNGMIINDYGVRQRYLETSLKMKSKISDKVEVTTQVIGIEFVKPNDIDKAD